MSILTDDNKDRFLLFTKAIILNLVLLIAILLLFEPTEKLDDYEMRNLLYGGATGEYSPFIMYTDVLFGKFLLLFVNVLPGVDWYWVIQYAMLFMAFVIVTIILMINGLEVKYVILFLVIPYYECFIRCTFTKTAGILVSVGALLIFLAVIEEGGVKKYILGMLCITVGMIIRRSVFLLGGFVFGGFFLVYLIKNKINANLIKKNNEGCNMFCTDVLYICYGR